MMRIPLPQEAIHKAWLYRTLTAICDEASLAKILNFKGGTCAAMLGWLDRFSVDLDFDFVGAKAEITPTRAALEKVFADLGLEIKDQSPSALQYFLKYVAQPGQRNTLKVDATFPVYENNLYRRYVFSEIDRVINAQTKETMFGNKLVALIDRYNKTGAIAGRDIYDIHRFFMTGTGYNAALITERTGQKLRVFFEALKKFIEKNINETILSQDLNTLLPYDRFATLRKVLKPEVLVFIGDELKRLASKG